jgi:hypothetical protein
MAFSGQGTRKKRNAGAHASLLMDMALTPIGVKQ